ncbi:sce7725 family protein [Crenobacter cavernae]|nr:sce7725 family protein [Crenobacter cavernae]
MPYLLSREREGASLARANDILPPAAPVIPIIEPVSRTWHTQWFGLSQWLSGGRRALLIVNPYQNDFEGGAPIISYAEINQAGLLDQSRIDDNALLPTLLIREPFDLEAVQHVLSVQPVKAVIHACMLEAEPLRALLAASEIEFHVFDDNATSRAYRRLFLSQGHTVLLRDAFVKTGSNQKYSETPYRLHDLPSQVRRAEVAGFADYLIETKSFPSNGAMSPKAAALHLGYLPQGEEEVWMQHFVGGPIVDVPRVAYSELFLLAAEKLVTFKRDHPEVWLDSHGCKLLIDAYNRRQNIQPADVKEYTLLHYIETMNRFCTEGAFGAA